MPDLDPAWPGRLRAVFGAPLGEVGYEHIEALVPPQVGEAADLDFKEALYGNSAGDKHELCKDIAAMRNHRGGVIVLGVRDGNGVAVTVPGVALSDDEARRMRQIVAAGTPPHAEFEIRPVAGRLRAAASTCLSRPQVRIALTRSSSTTAYATPAAMAPPLAG